ncbi:MAG: hypothetical protein E7076_02295 [Bacteroidales bacterium]|nr:hypothetical protein [Bacteroidales bacterium]
MSYKYIGTPKYISFSECRENNHVFAPSKYTRFLPQNEWLFVPMSQICTESNTKIEIERKCEYNYTEIGDIDVSSGMVNHTHYYGMNLPSENPKHCQCGDILISTVRTYRGGVGIITEELSNHCCSPAILVIRNVAKIITKEYLLAILKTDFFVEQILGFQTRGMYPRLDSDAMNKVLIPIPKNVDTLKYVSILQRSFLNKYSLIRQRHANILQLIEKELTENQKSNKFNYHLPRLNEVKEIGRLDASLYKLFFKKHLFSILNYKNGYSPLTQQQLKLIPGPSLELRLLGTRIDSDHYEKGFYRLITPKQITNYGIVRNEEFIGTPAIIANIQFGDILFGESGTGRTMVFLDDDNNTINNAHAHILRSMLDNDIHRVITIRSILQFYKEIGMTDCMTVGGSGGHLSPSYFDRIMIPNFPESKQKEIAALYHNPQEYLTDDFTLDNFEEKDNEYNLAAGIYELDKTSKRLKEKLNKAIDDIVNDREVQIEF